MEAAIGEFRFTRLEKVVFGPGRLAGLGGEMEGRGLRRGLLVTGRTLSRSYLLEQVRAAAGDRLAEVFPGARQHVPSGTVAALAQLAERVDADCLISFGGGSPIDTAKAAAKALLERDGRDLPHLALPTTLSAGEFTPGGGVTGERTRVKKAVRDPRIQPRVVILDPALTEQTPDRLWASTGVRALDHAVEAALSVRHQVLTDTLATRAIRLLRAHLPCSMAEQGDRQIHRGYCQLAAWLSIFGAINTGFGISHALGHQIGPRWDVPHGITSCITLPHVMRYLAERGPERFLPVAEGFEVPFDPRRPHGAAAECAARAADFIRGLNLPMQLRDFAVPRGELSSIADTVLDEVRRSRTVDAGLERADVVSLLEAAW